MTGLVLFCDLRRSGPPESGISEGVRSAYAETGSGPSRANRNDNRRRGTWAGMDPEMRASDMTSRQTEMGQSRVSVEVCFQTGRFQRGSQEWLTL